MSLTFAVIRCAPRKQRRKTRLLVRLAILLAASAAAGWLIHLITN